MGLFDFVGLGIMLVLVVNCDKIGMLILALAHRVGGYRIPQQEKKDE